MWPNYPGKQLVGTAFKFRQRMQHLPSCAHVLYETLTLVISRCCLAEEVPKFLTHVQGCSLNPDCFMTFSLTSPSYLLKASTYSLMSQSHRTCTMSCHRFTTVLFWLSAIVTLDLPAHPQSSLLDAGTEHEKRELRKRKG